MAVTTSLATCLAGPGPMEGGSSCTRPLLRNGPVKQVVLKNIVSVLPSEVVKRNFQNQGQLLKLYHNLNAGTKYFDRSGELANNGL